MADKTVAVGANKTYAGFKARQSTVAVGAWGGKGGRSWDDGIYTGVRAIELSYGETIGTFNVTYDLNGKPFQGPKHKNPFTYYRTVKIELSPEEYIVSLSGYYDTWSLLAVNTPVIRSLTIKTNMRTFGPFGIEKGTKFDLPIKKGFVVGFFGRSGSLLHAIGVRLAL